MLDPLTIALFAFKCTFGLLLMIQRKRLLEEVRKGGNVEDHKFRKFILAEIHEVSLKLDIQSRKDLNSSQSFYNEGLEYLIALSENTTIGNESTENAQSSKSTFYVGNVDKRGPTTEDLKRLKHTDDLDKSAKEAHHIDEAKKLFEKASDKATEAFNDRNLYTSERVHAMYIRLLAKILQNMDKPSNMLPSCRTYFKEMHDLPKVKKVFGDAVKNKDKKSPFSKEEDRNVFVGVCEIHRIVYNVTQLDSQHRGPWTWPCIEIEVSKVIHNIDPLRDARVSEALCKIYKEQTENVLNSAVNLPVAWAFGTEDGKLISPRDISTNTEGQFIVADHGDCKIKVFDERGTFLSHYSFHPLSRRLSIDEEVLSVATDSEDNSLVLIKIDKYRYEVHLFNKNGKLFHKFPLREGFVRCSPIVNDKNEVLVIIEGKESKRSAVEVYKANGQFVHSFGHGDLIEPNDMTVADEGRLMILDSNDRIVMFSAEGKYLPKKTIVVDVVPSEAVAFHSASKQVAVSSSNISGPGDHVQISIYNKDGERAHDILQGKERSEKGEKKSVPPKIAVTKTGSIAILAGIASNSKVIVI